MRIAFFTETFLPKVDGIVNTLCYLLDYLAAAGHESLLLAPSGDRTQYADTPIVAYQGVRFPFYPELQLVPPTVPVRRHLTTFQPDLVHVLNPISLGLSGLRLARSMHIPVVASFHTDLPGFASRWGLSMLSRPIWRALRTVHNRADLTLCPSETTRAKLQAQEFERLKVWTRGVDTERFRPSRRQAAMRMRLTDGNPDAPLLLFVSRLSPEKRADWLLPVLEAHPEARLAIVGDGPAREKLEAQFAGTPTVFTGYLRGEALAQAYASAECFVFPAAHETLGNVVLEAMASGLPVVAAGSGGPLDLVDHGRNGLLFAPNDPQSLVSAVGHMLHQPDQARAMAQEARRDAEQRSWDMVFDRLIADYSAVIDSYSPPRRSTARFIQSQPST